MSRRVLIIAVVVAVLLSTMVAPAAANPLKVGDAVSVSAEVWHSLSGGSPVFPPPIQLAGGGGCGGSGNCTT